MLLRKLKVVKAVLLAAVTALGVGYLGHPSAVARQPAEEQAADKQVARKDTGEDRAKGTTDPPGVPLEARLVARKDTYTLDLGGKTPEEFRKLVESRHYPAAPEVDLVLEFHNTGDQEIKFLVGGHNPDIPVQLRLDGPGAMNVTLPAGPGSKSQSRPPEQVSLAPGKSHALPFGRLWTSNAGHEGCACYWTQPGEFTLVATYQTGVFPPPKDAKPWNKEFGTVTLTSSPVKLKVEGEGKPAEKGNGHEAEAKGTIEPAGVPLEARLVAKKDTYTLDLGGKTPEQFRKLPHDGPYPASPEVDLALEFHNTGDKEIKLLVGGTNPDIPLLLQLHGHGAVNVALPALAAGIRSANPEPVLLAPGQSYILPIKSLRTKNVGREGSASWWTEPGEYKLIATYHTAVFPAPKDARASYWYKEFGTVTVTSSLLNLKVVEAQK